jgi:hypothetical protein
MHQVLFLFTYKKKIHALNLIALNSNNLSYEWQKSLNSPFGFTKEKGKKAKI